MKLTLIRHGETEENVQKIIQGQLPGHLTAKGKAQASEAAEKLKHEQFDAIYCSDLQRCLDTAEPIRAHFPHAPFITDTLLRERRGGALEGQLAVGELADTTRADWYTARRAAGAESWDDVRLRQIPLLNRLLAVYPNGSLLIITHGGVVKGIRALLEQRTLAEIDSEDTPNAGIWHEDMNQPITRNE